MKFKDNEHKTTFEAILKKMHSNDVYYKTLAYLLALDNDCRKHINDLYSFSEQCIIPEGLEKKWQTGTSRKTTRLAFNLYTDGVRWWCDNEEEFPYCSVANIFCCSYAPYYWEAIKIRYPEYTAE